MNTHQTLQDHFLLRLKQEQESVSIFLVNGIKLHGVINEFDESVIMLKNSITQMIYKHSISTVVPSRLIELDSSEPKETMAN